MMGDDAREKTLANYEAADKAFMSGTYRNAADAELLTMFNGLINQQSLNESTRNRDLIRAITIHSMLLGRATRQAEARGRRMEVLGLVLALIAALVGAAQLWVVLR